MKDNVQLLYESLHSMPEVGFKEFDTTKFIGEKLRTLGYEVSEIPNYTGLVAVLSSGEEGVNLGLRADIDALEFSRDGSQVNIHACGHDANAAMVLATAAEVSRVGILKGKLTFVFQPAEEILLGAKAVVESGLIDEVEELIGIHLRPIDELEFGAATPALRHGASHTMNYSIDGLNSHAARPHLGVNVLDVITLIANGINSLKFDPKVSHSIKITKIHTYNDTYNIIPDKAELAFDIRAQTNELMEAIIDKTSNVVSNMAELNGATSKLIFSRGSPAAEYDDNLLEEVENSIKKKLGKAVKELTTPGSEDFHYYSAMLGIKTAYIGLGADLTPGLHNPQMGFNRQALSLGVDILKDIVFSKLGHRLPI